MMTPEEKNEDRSEEKREASRQERERQIVEEVRGIAESLCRAEALELVFIEFHREPQGRVLRVYIDKQGGVTLDDCALVSRQLGDILDAALEDIGPYRLEISSPGANRPLGRPEDYERFRGEKVRIKTRRPLDGRKNYKGILGGIDKEHVVVQCGNEEFRIPIEEISIARLVNFNGEK
jgi:ribosome maturation factor RimP